MKYGIICAMEEEIKELLNHLNNEKEQSIGDMKYYEGNISGNEVVLVQSGIGKVQAGINAAFLINNFDVDFVINSGSAGGIGDGLHVGDVVLSTGTAYHDAEATAFGYKKGQLPGQPQIFPADKDLLARVREAAIKSDLSVKEGLIVTGDQFIDSKAKIKKIKEIYPDALCCEMEGAAVGQVAHDFSVPYLVIRAMSDVGDEEASQSFDEFIIEAGKRSAKMILTLLSKEA
ncbi:5'-methylthioadenosine/adenosylhomocysteine nucleosidase [Ligilactobacillus cholophilus]|uniref:5'-methylthioadenosine/adenosylhomocysteine nucleosidase n=1 Tax=Ligilactobacillus cholophilus TaxID=3050131 RepID=UPI0025B2749A|nr:5'-methylthioadenosine/adenosylhomocysteine nucleosidase [Ligilactobacillus cholophilus]